MLKIEVINSDISFTYNGDRISFSAPKKNAYTGLYTFDITWSEGSVLGVPVTSGTNVVKGNGTPFYKLVFIDDASTDGSITDIATTSAYVLEEGDGL